MVTVLLKGRLGNNLFQIAAGASLAKANGDNFCAIVPDVHLHLGVSTSESEIEELQNSIFRNVNIMTEMSHQLSIFEEKQFAYHPIPYSSNLALSGYFQSERYFNEPLVRELFSIDNSTKSYIDKKYGSLLSKGITSVHIRRGDYIKNLDFHPICSLSYFRKAMDFIGSDRSFLIVTNDLDWCKRKFKGENVFFTERESAVVDLYLQSMCQNNIISNSSFSWWGAWLNSNPDKIVITPSPWFGISAKHMDTSDLIPTRWVKLKNRMPAALIIVAYLRKKKRDFYKLRRSFGLK